MGMVSQQTRCQAAQEDEEWAVGASLVRIAAADNHVIAVDLQRP